MKPRKRPSPLQKIFLKMPLLLHKLGLGGWEKLFGAQWMLLTTTGRKTGKPRQTMVDVIDYDPTSDTYYIEAAYGTRADWVKNIQSTSTFTAQVGKRIFTATNQLLPEQETSEKLVQFFRKKPAYTRAVMKMIGITFNNEDDLRTYGKYLNLFAITPQPANQTATSPAPQ